MRPRNTTRRYAGAKAHALARAIVLIVTGAVVTLAYHADTSVAQSATAKPTPPATIIVIEVAPVILGEPGSGTRLAVKLSPAAAVPPNSFLRIKGLPAAVQPVDEGVAKCNRCGRPRHNTPVMHPIGHARGADVLHR